MALLKKKTNKIKILLIDELNDLNQGSWASLVGVTVVMVIISLILIAVLGFSKKGRTGKECV